MMKKYTKNLLTCLLIGATSAAFAFNDFEDELSEATPYHQKWLTSSRKNSTCTNTKEINDVLHQLRKCVDNIISSNKYNLLLREQQLGKILKEIRQYQEQAFECDQYDTWKELLDYANYYYYREVPDEIEDLYE